jgi:hypothetical protein
MKKLLAVTIVAVSTVWAATPASAGPVFDLTATTVLTTNASMRGTFTPMSMLIGSIELTDAAAMRIMMGTPTSFVRADLASFQFSVGNLMLNSAGAINVDFSATLAGDGNTFSAFRLLFTTPMGVGGCDVLCMTDFGRFSTARTTANVAFQTTGPMGMGIVLDLFSARPFAFARRQVAEPGTLGLLAFGLLAQVVVARRRRAR